MLSNKGFDLWANHYDQTVQVSEENDLYPFAGYKNILNAIFNEVMQKENSRVLDIGFGTGILTHRLYEHGHQIDGIDFSAKMIEIAQSKMSEANLVEWDFTNGLPEVIKAKTYDSIVSTYALHHLTDEEKVEFIRSLLDLLPEDGKIYIGDIAFQSREKLEICREANLDHWDDDEYYFVFDELQAALQSYCKCVFYPFSHCGGVIIISR